MSKEGRSLTAITGSSIRGVLAGLSVFFALGLTASGQAIEIQGTVVEVSGTIVRITFDSELIPNVGDRVEIFAAVPGVGEAPLAGNWEVIDIGEGFAEVAATGDAPRPQAGQRVIITSENPRTVSQLELEQAVEVGDANALRRLLGLGASPDARMENGYTLLIKSAGDDDTDITEALIQAGADLNATEPEYGTTALMLAAGEDHVEIVRMLIRAGADVNVQAGGNDDGEGAGFTALMIGAMNGHEAVVSELLAGGADRAMTNRDGATALDLAEAGGHDGVVRLLRSPG